MDSFPSVHSLAGASEQEVLKQWEGLGYYSRARNLHATAKYISEKLNGEFPRTYEGLLKLKGIGPYTAAAIASICFHEPAPVLDGNVFRFISRFFGVKDDISKNKTRAVFQNILKEIIPDYLPGEFNQAIMEFGATVCKPSPDCNLCIFKSQCFAAKHQQQSDFPVKLSKPKVTERYFHYFILEHDGNFLMRKRSSSIWMGLYEFLLIDGDRELDTKDLPLAIDKAEFVQKSDEIKHVLTHRILWHTFYDFKVDEKYFLELQNEFELESYSRQEVLDLPKPKSIINYLQQVGF